MKVMVIPTVIGAIRTIPKGLVWMLEELEIEGQADTSETTALLISARILRKVLETWWLVGWLFGFYGVSTFVGYLMPNPFLYE